jgi:L-erythro-3,5-diaminohexanoate dehydrogenase
VAVDSVGVGRVLEPRGVLPQAAWRLDARPELGADEVRVRVERLNLDAASFRQLRGKHGGDGRAVRQEVLDIIRTRGKMHNPVTGSGGMLIGTVEEAGPESVLGLRPGDRVATLVSLTLTPLWVGSDSWDGESEQVPCEGHAILFGRSIAAVLPDDMSSELALAVFDVCGAPALVDRVVRGYLPGGDGGRRGSGSQSGDGREGAAVTVTVLGGAGKSGSLALAAAKRAGARTRAVVVSERERDALRGAGVADEIAVADARDPLAVAATGKATVTVVCVDVPGCEHGAILATEQGGTVVFFSMATSFAAAALGAEGLAADVTMLVGNGFVPGHAAFALDVVRSTPGVRELFEARIAAH